MEGVAASEKTALLDVNAKINMRIISRIHDGAEF